MMIESSKHSNIQGDKSVTGRTISNWRELIELEMEFSSNEDGEEWVFRGQPSDDRLISTLDELSMHLM